jgi:hypothetical protein
MSDTHTRTDRYTVESDLHRYQERSTGRTFHIPIWKIVDTDAECVVAIRLDRQKALDGCARINVHMDARKEGSDL